MMDLDLENFKYELPESRIARFPLESRDQSKLLFYNKGKITHHIFRDVATLLPSQSLLVFNETKVIPARMLFKKRTGAAIEIMLLEPIAPSGEVNITMSSSSPVIWECMIRNLKKWKTEEILEKELNLEQGRIRLEATWSDKTKRQVRFEWVGSPNTFSDILDAAGKVPLPPYLKREPIPEDKSRYQTVYSKHKGAVAAPTAGLHFTHEILKEIHRLGHQTDYLTLHVSAGTFQPIQERDIRKHNMHTESILVKKSNILKILSNPGHLIAVGTTSMRTLESIYWFGVKLLKDIGSEFFIEKLYPYEHDHDNLPDPKKALLAVIKHMEMNDTDLLRGETQIFIFPGYDFRICDGIITNYHMPGSTLMLLVAAFVGEDWRKIYEAALENQYRFLSYGDSSLLFPNLNK